MSIVQFTMAPFQPFNLFFYLKIYYFLIAVLNQTDLRIYETGIKQGYVSEFKKFQMRNQQSSSLLLR